MAIIIDCSYHHVETQIPYRYKMYYLCNQQLINSLILVINKFFSSLTYSSITRVYCTLIPLTSGGTPRLVVGIIRSKFTGMSENVVQIWEKYIFDETSI